MFAAACRGDVELVRFHLEAGVDADFSHPEFQETALVAAVLARHGDVADLLLDHGADPALLSVADGLTPLEAARSTGLATVERRLRSLGAGQPYDDAPQDGVRAAAGGSAGGAPAARRRRRGGRCCT